MYVLIMHKSYHVILFVTDVVEVCVQVWNDQFHRYGILFGLLLYDNVSCLGTNDAHAVLMDNLQVEIRQGRKGGIYVH